MMNDAEHFAIESIILILLRNDTFCKRVFKGVWVNVWYETFIYDYIKL